LEERMDHFISQSPAQHILSLIGKLMEGRNPEIEEIMDIRHAIELRMDLYSTPRGLHANMVRHLSPDVADYVALLTMSPRNVSNAKYRALSAKGYTQLLYSIGIMLLIWTCLF
jgi:hypothetical protein